MLPRRSLRRPLSLLILPALSLGCFEDEPLSGTLPDAGVDASVGELDASSPDASDASAGPIACDVAHPCDGDAVCAPEGLCAPRCDANTACWIAQSDRRILELLADGETLYFATAPSQDALGNPFGDGEIRRLPPLGQAEVLRDDLKLQNFGRVYLSDTGDHLMWHEDGKLRRASKTDPSVVEPLYATDCGSALPLPDGKLAVQAPGGLFLGSLDGKAPLTNVSAAVDFDPQTDDAQLAQCLRLHYADETVFRARPVPITQPVAPHLHGIVGFDLRTNTETAYAGASWADESVLGVVPPYFYDFQPHGALTVQRRGFDGDFDHDAVIVNLNDAYNARTQLRGGWIYVAAPHAPPNNVVTLVRNSLAPPVKIQLLAPEGSFKVPPDSYVTALAVSDRAMFIAVATLSKSWIYRQPLPAN